MSHSPQQYFLGRVTLDLQYTLLLSVIRWCKYYKAARNSPSSTKGQLITEVSDGLVPKGGLSPLILFSSVRLQSPSLISPTWRGESLRSPSPSGHQGHGQQHQGWLPGDDPVPSHSSVPRAAPEERQLQGQSGCFT